MSIHVMSWVFRHSEERLGNRLVLIALADHANDDGTGAWPSVETVAEKARMSPRQARRCLRALEDSGAIVRAGKTKYGTTEWAVKMTPTNGADNMSGVTNPVDSRSEMSPEPSFEPPLVEEATKDVASSTSRPPKLTKVGGRDLAFDALAEVCGISPGSPRVSEIAVALNGARGRPGIRTQAWHEVRQRFSDRATVNAISKPDRFTGYLVAEITERARMWHAKMPGATLTPTALAKWWTDLPGLPDPRNGRSGSAKDALPIAEAAVQRARREGGT